ncbi:MAG: flagellar filament capping protein FliD, partial [Mariprofundaceae bacterium]
MAGLSGISGLVAGFDTRTAVDELLNVQRVQIDTLKQKQDAESARQDALATLNLKLLDLKNTARSMADASTFYSYTAQLTSSNPAVPASNLLDISGATGINAGAHQIVVQQLAAAQREASSAAVKDAAGAAVASDTQALGMSGSFQLNGVTIAVAASDSLKDIAAAVNQSGSGVHATIIKSAANDFRLILESDQTGSAGFSLAGADLDAAGALAGLNLGAGGQANARQTLQAAQDAVIQLDGVTVTRSANTISDALAGITIDLKQADPGTTVNVDIGVDHAAVRDLVQTFVDQYNAVQDFINQQFAFDPNDPAAGGPLAGDPMLRGIQRALSDSLLQGVPGLAPDRDALVKVGIEPDANGRLTINPARFDAFLNNDVDAIRDLFVARGVSGNDSLSYIVSGPNTPSGSYAVNITQAAARASVTGSADVVNGALAAAETVTITGTGGAQAVVNLSAGMKQADIVAAMNAEFARTYAEEHQMSIALVAGGQPATGSTTLAELGLGVAAGDTIAIGGTDRNGNAVNGSFTVLDPAMDTIGDLLTAINQAFGGQATASIDASGHIRLTDNQAGVSQLSLTLLAGNEGGGALDFGNDVVLTEGRGAMPLEALAAGVGVAIQTRAYGASQGFSISQSADGLGIPDQSVAGVDVAGTINGLAANGAGQVLTGASGEVDGLVLMYQGAGTGAVGTLQLGLGVAASYGGLLEMFANPVTGLISNAIQASQGIHDTLGKRIDDLELQMQLKREQLTRAFAEMERAMAV